MNKLFMIIFLFASFVSYGQPARIKSDTVYIDHKDLSAREAMNAMIVAETNLSYKYQVLMAFMALIVVLVGFVQYNTSSKQHEMFKSALESMARESQSVKANSDSTFQLSKEILGISKGLIEQEMQELNNLITKKAELEAAVNQLKEDNAGYKPAVDIIKEINAQFDNPDTIKKACMDHATNTETKLTVSINELTKSIDDLKKEIDSLKGNQPQSNALSE